jgi:hypothetical protein
MKIGYLIKSLSALIIVISFYFLKADLSFAQTIPSFRAMYLAKTGEDFIGVSNSGPNGSSDQHIKLINLKTDVSISTIRVTKSTEVWEYPYNGKEGIRIFGSGSQRDIFIESEKHPPYNIEVVYSDNSTDTAVTNFGKPSSYGLSVAASIRDSKMNINEGLAISGNFAYVTSNASDRLNVVDISNPLDPRIVGSIQHTFLDGAEDVFISGNYAFVTTEAPGANRLTIVDVTDPRNPTIKSSVQDSVRLESTEDVFVLNNFVYVTAEVGDRLTIINAQNKSQPRIVGSIKDSVRLNGPEGIWVVGSMAYIACEAGNTLTIVDVSNPANPVISGSIKSSFLDGASGIQVSGNHAFVSSERSSRFTIVNVLNPSQPKVVSSLNSEYIKDTDNLTLVGNTVYISAHEGSSVAAIDVTNRSKPYIREYLFDPTNLRAANAVQVSGGYLYVTAQLEDGSNTSKLTVIKLPDYSSIDNTAPEAFISSPEDGSAIQNNFTIRTNSNERNPSVININFDSIKVGFCRENSCNLDYDASLATSGDHTITATVYDNFGNSSKRSIKVIKN